MPNLFDANDRQSILLRLERLQPGSGRLWGKMEPAQMLAHCTLGLEVATGDRPLRQKLIGKLLAPFVRSTVLGERPFGRNGPTDPSFVVSDARDLARERARLLEVVERFCARGPAEAARQTHAFLGRLSGDEWGVLMYKHLDHHLRQFGL